MQIQMDTIPLALMFVYRLCFGIAVAALALLASAEPASADQSATPYPGGRWTPPAPAYGVAVRRNLLVKMRDGVQLPVDVYLPADPSTGAPANGPFPVLLTRYWYTKPLLEGQPFANQDPEYFVRRGYIYVSADVRGTGRSHDAGSYLGDGDAMDGAELADWTATLPASNGLVGFIGCSAMGQTQLSTAAVLGNHSRVKALIPACVPGDQYRDTYTENGVWRPTWPGLLMASPTIFGDGMVPELSRVYVESQQGGDASFDRAWWSRRNFVMRAKEIVDSGAAVLLWNGWQDVGYGGLELLAALQNAAFNRPVSDPVWPGSRVTARYQLILGDWQHGEGLDAGLQLQWFETWLRGMDTGLPTGTRTPMHVQDRVTKQWFNFGAYPMLGRYTPYYLGPGTLESRPPITGADHLDWRSSPDSGLEYTSESFLRPMRLAGPIGVRLNASSSNEEAQFRFELFDRAPNGDRALISHNMILGSLHALDEHRSWRDSAGNPVRPLSRLDAEEPLARGESVAYEVMLPPTLWTIQPNHRLVLRVSSRPGAAECPLFPMLGGPRDNGCFLRSTTRARLENGSYSIVRGGRDPSLLNLPLSPADEFVEIRSGLTPTSPSRLPLDW